MQRYFDLCNRAANKAYGIAPPNDFMAKVSVPLTVEEYYELVESLDRSDFCSFIPKKSFRGIRFVINSRIISLDTNHQN